MIALIDCRVSKKTLDALNNYGFEPLLRPPSPSLGRGVASHTDMLVFIGFGRLFCHASYYENNKKIIDSIASAGKLTICLSDEEWSQKYPRDVLFNACLIKKKLICNENTVSKHILNAAHNSGAEVINVKQGYTKCSICKVSENAIITSDRHIAKICESVDIDTLLIREGHISLPPYNFGFIGGTSGQYNDTVYFCGSLSAHPDGNVINEFCLKHEKKAISLSDEKLQDVGSIFFIGE